MRVGDTVRLEIATGGDPARAYIGVVAGIAERGNVYTTSVYHDNECPCTSGTNPITKCTCEIIGLKITRRA